MDATACANLYREKRCRDAWLARNDPTADPSQFAPHVFRACRAAYCPKLRPPKPAACAGDPSWLPSELVVPMAELNRRILMFELGAARAEEIASAFAAAPRAAPAPKSAVPPAMALPIPVGCKVESEAKEASVAVLISVTAERVKMGATTVAVGGDMAERVQKVDALYEALKRMRAAWRSAHPTAPFTGAALLQVTEDAPAVVVKSVFQTVAYAGFGDALFLACG